MSKNIWEEASLKYLPVRKIRIANYQRLVTTGRSKDVIRKIVAEFDPGAFQPLMINKRNNGEYYCYDGQHKLIALRIKSIETAPCWVIEGRTEQQEAGLFGMLNGNRKSMNSVDLFHSNIASEDKESLKIKEIVEKNGFSVERDYHPSNKINSINTLKNIYRKNGEKSLDRILFLVNEIWGNDKNRMHNKILKGMSDIVKTYEDCLQDYIFIRKMQNYKPFEIIIEGDLKKRTSKMPYAETIWTLYNKGMRRNKLPNRCAIGL